MNARELRIGNFINSRIGVTELNINQLEEIFNLTHVDLGYKPIPLDEEWLLKFGFTKEIYTNNHPDFFDEICYELVAKEFFMSFADDFSLAIYDSKENQDDKLGIIPDWRDIQYVHQLQNLYFSLNGEELTLNEI